MPAEAGGDVMQGLKRDVQLSRKGMSSKENQARISDAEACQPIEQHMANTSQSVKPVLSRGKPSSLLPSG